MTAGCVLHHEIEMPGGHDVYDIPNIFKAVADHFQTIDLESRVFIYFRGGKNRCIIEPDFRF